MALDYAKISFFAQYLENILRQNFTKFYICIDNDKIYVGIVSCHFLLICNRAMALDLCQNFISAQYLEYKLTDFYQTLYNHLY